MKDSPLGDINLIPEMNTSKSARRALYSASVATLGIANLTFISTKLSVLKLEVSFEQERLVAVGQIAVFIFLVVFLLRASSGFSDLLVNNKSIKMRRQHSIEKFNWEQNWNTPDQYQDDPKAELNEMSLRQTRQLNTLASRRLKLSQFFTLVAEVVVSYLLPVGLGLIAIFHPHGLRILTDNMI